LAILTIFRPNLDYCVALEVVPPLKRKPKALKAEAVETTPIAAAVAMPRPISQSAPGTTSQSAQAERERAHHPPNLPLPIQPSPIQPLPIEPSIQRGVQVDGVLFGFLRWMVLRLTIFVPSSKTIRT
jgi:hypothetical protein